MYALLPALPLWFPFAFQKLENDEEDAKDVAFRKFRAREKSSTGCYTVNECNQIARSLERVIFILIMTLCNSESELLKIAA